MGEDEVVDRHTLACTVWTSDELAVPCSCGAEFPLLAPEPDTTAHHLNQLDREVAS